MVDAHGRAKVLDFGLAKLSAPAAVDAVGAEETTRSLAVEQVVSEEGVILGTVPYLSPEQVEGKPLDACSDIFSFGAVLYEMITGQHAFRGKSKISTLAVGRGEPEPRLGSYRGGLPRLIATQPLIDFWEANRTKRDGVLFDLPAGRTTLKRVRRHLGFHNLDDISEF